MNAVENLRRYVRDDGFIWLTLDGVPLRDAIAAALPELSDDSAPWPPETYRPHRLYYVDETPVAGDGFDAFKPISRKRV